MPRLLSLPLSELLRNHPAPPQLSTFLLHGTARLCQLL